MLLSYIFHAHTKVVKTKMFPYQNMQNMTEERNNMIASTKQAKPYKNLSVYIDNKVHEHLNDNGIRKPYGMYRREQISRSYFSKWH